MQELDVTLANVNFDQLDKDLDNSETLTDRLEALYKHFKNELPLFRKMLIIAPGNRYVYGIEVDDEYKAAKVGGFLLLKHFESKFKNAKEYLDERLNRTSSEQAKKSLIEAELKHYRDPLERVEVANKMIIFNPTNALLSPYYLGYESEKRGISPKFPPNLDRPTFEEIERGMINCRLELYLLTGHAEGGEPSAEQDGTRQNTSGILESGPRQKLILLFELGLLKKLKADYSYLSDSDLARVICGITGLATEDVDAVRKEINPVMYNTASSVKAGRPLNRKSVHAAKVILNGWGIKVKNLPDFD